jgi:hypothetical protein
VPCSLRLTVNVRAYRLLRLPVNVRACLRLILPVNVQVFRTLIPRVKARVLLPVRRLVCNLRLRVRRPLVRRLRSVPTAPSGEHNVAPSSAPLVRRSVHLRARPPVLRRVSPQVLFLALHLAFPRVVCPILCQARCLVLSPVQPPVYRRVRSLVLIRARTQMRA